MIDRYIEGAIKDYVERKSKFQDDVKDALNVVNEAANHARHQGDYAKANALVKAKVTLARAARCEYR